MTPASISTFNKWYHRPDQRAAEPRRNPWIAAREQLAAEHRELRSINPASPRIKVSLGKVGCVLR
jgi:hypothetical protein